jgi:hypothetical protein
MSLATPVLVVSMLAAPAAPPPTLADLALQVAVRELNEIPKGIQRNSTVCIRLGEAGVSDEQLRFLRASAPKLSLKPYTIDCLVPVTELLHVVVWRKDDGGTATVLADWSRKADESCFSDGVRKRVYEATSDAAGWRISLAKHEKPGWGTPKP